MKKCSECGTTEGRIINSPKYGADLCSKCYQKFKHTPFEKHDLPSFGELKLNNDGKPICHICGRAYKKLGSHVTLTHGLTALEYKKEFGLDVGSGMMCEDSVELARKRAYENYEKSILENLIVKGKDSRFKRGGSGRTKDKVSEQTRRKLAKHGYEMFKKQD